MLLMFLAVTFVTALPHSSSLLLCLSPTLTSFLSLFPDLLFPISISCPHFVSICPSHQPSAAVRGYHSSKAAATGSSGGQGAWSGPSFTRTNLQHYLSHHHQQPHHSQSPHTSYAYCPAHTAVSTADFVLLDVCLSLVTHICTSQLFLSSFSFLITPSVVSISGRYYQESS